MIEDSPVALTVAAFMASRDGHLWKGSATALKTSLETNDQTEQRVTTGKSWPRDVRAFGVQLWRMQTALRKAGIELTEGERSTDRRRGRTLELRVIEPTGESTPDDRASQAVNKPAARTPAARWSPCEVMSGLSACPSCPACPIQPGQI